MNIVNSKFKSLQIKRLVSKTVTSAILVVFLFSCGTADKIKKEAIFVPSLEKISWQHVDGNLGVEYFYHSESGVKYHCVRIDLTQPNIKILAYPKSEGDSQTLQNPIRLKKFVKLTDAKIAMNTTPYMKDGKILGIHMEKGVKLSKEVKRYSALYFETKLNGEYVAKISVNQKEEDFENAISAFGGFFTILKDGKIESFNHTSYDARSAVGITKEGNTLYLLSVEKGFFGRGLSYPECAEILKELGSSDALEFDGGSSTSFFVTGKVFTTESFRKNSAYIGFNF